MKKSFTLIELLVVIAIIGLLVIIIAIPINRARRGASIARILQYEASLHRYLGADIVGWWKFDEGEGSVAYDISGHNNDGTLVNNPQWVDGVPGKEGYALEFDGVGDYIYISNNSSLNFGTNSFTTAVWLYIDINIEGTTAFLGKCGSTNGWRWRRATDGRLAVSLHDSLSWKSYYSDKNFLMLGEWIHVITVVDQSSKEISFYLNGELDSIEKNIRDYNLGTNGTFQIGRSNFAAIYYKGLISDLRIYSRALTSEEINTLYTETKDKYIAEE